MEVSIERREEAMEVSIERKEEAMEASMEKREVAMDVSIRRTFPNDLFNFVVDMCSGTGGRFTVHTVWAETENDVKKWVAYVQKLIRKRRRSSFGLSADRSLNYANGNGNSLMSYKKESKDIPYELLQICIEDQCLLYKLYSFGKSCSKNFNPKMLKDLLHDSRVTVVGVGIENVARRLEEDHGWLMPKVVELRDLAAEAQKTGEKPMINLSRFSIAKLAKLVLGEDMNLVKPAKIRWWSVSFNFNRPPRFHSEDLIMYASVEAFLISQMGTKLILNTKTAAATSYKDDD